MMTKVCEYEADAAIFKLLAAFYSINPSSVIIDAVRSLETADDGLTACIDKLKSHTADDITELKVDWTKLFRGVSPDYGPIPPYEQLYTGADLPALLKGLAVIYTDAGFAADGERHDYIGTQLAFLSYLAEKAAAALKDGNEASAEQYAAVFESFLNEHPAKWFKAFMEKALVSAETVFYQGVLELTDFCLT